MKAIAGVNLRKALTLPLVIFVVASVVYAVSTEARRESVAEVPVVAAPEPAAADSAPAPETAQTGERVVRAYYFYSNQRCFTCRNIESHSKGALEEFFGDHMEAGSLLWTPLNVETPANRHYIQDFQLAMPGVVLAEEEDGRALRFTNLTAVWQYARTPERLRGYVRDETARFLEGDLGS